MLNTSRLSGAWQPTLRQLFTAPGADAAFVNPPPVVDLRGTGVTIPKGWALFLKPQGASTTGGLNTLPDFPSPPTPRYVDPNARRRLTEKTDPARTDVDPDSVLRHRRTTRSKKAARAQTMAGAPVE